MLQGQEAVSLPSSATRARYGTPEQNRRRGAQSLAALERLGLAGRRDGMGNDHVGALRASLRGGAVR